MALAIENVRFGTAAHPNGINSGSAGLTAGITTSGSDRLVCILIGTGRSREPFPNSNWNIHNPTTSVTASGLTFTRQVLDQWQYNKVALLASGDASFPNANMDWTLFTAPAASAVSGLAWSSVQDGDGFSNNKCAFVFAISGLPDINNFDIQTPVIVEDLTASATRPHGALTTSQEAIVVGAFAAAVGAAFSFTGMSGYTLTQDTAAGNSTTNVKWAVYYAREASAITAKDIGEPSGTTTVWHGALFAIGSPDPIPASANALVTSVAAEVMHTGVEPHAMITSVAAEVMHAGGVPNARVTNVAVEVMTSVAPAPPLDGGRFLEASFQTKDSLRFSEADYDSIWSMGDRNVSGIMSFGVDGVAIVPGATFASSHDGNYAHPFGSGLAISGGLQPGDAMWVDFHGEAVEIHAFKFLGTEDPQWGTEQIVSLYGGIGVGQYAPDPYGEEFDAFVPSQAVEDADLALNVSEYLTTPREGDKWSFYAFVAKSTYTPDDNRFANEIHYKIAHSTLDGGDRRPTNDRPDKRVLFTMSSDWTFTVDVPDRIGDPQDALFDGVPVYLGAPLPGDDTKNGLGGYSIIKDPVESNGIQTTIGAWLQFEFPRKVIPKHLMLVVETQEEEYDSGDLPMHYGRWHWEYSNDGVAWTSIGSAWSFSESAFYMVAPRTGNFGLSGIGDGATHWRMVLNSGPAFRENYVLCQFMFNLTDSGSMSTTLRIDFSDDVDGLRPTVTIVGASPYNVSFTDGTSDTLNFTLSNVPNFTGSLAFTDGTSDALEFYSDLLPSIYPQTIVVATGRK